MLQTSGVVTYTFSDERLATRFANALREEPRVVFAQEGCVLMAQDYTRSGAAALERAWRHVQKEREQEARPYACGDCDKRYHHRVDLTRHRWKHHQRLGDSAVEARSNAIWLRAETAAD